MTAAFVIGVMIVIILMVMDINALEVKVTLLQDQLTKLIKNGSMEKMK